MSPLFRDLARVFPQLAEIMDKPEEAARFMLALNILHPHGVVLGGVYHHFKGKDYRVIGIVRDADDWMGEHLVHYQEVTDARHVAIRKVTQFLAWEEREGYSGPKFRLMGVS